MTTTEELINYTIEVTDYAEFELGLDPLGAGDLLYDLSRYAQWRFVEEGYAKPEVVWEEFKETSFYKESNR